MSERSAFFELLLPGFGLVRATQAGALSFLRTAGRPIAHVGKPANEGAGT